MSVIFDYLKNPNMPLVIREAVKLLGTVEIPGPNNNSEILKWVKEINQKESNWFDNDDIPWCGLFVAICVHRSKRKPVSGYLRAMAWSVWGVKATTPSIGDVLVFVRKNGGHVGFYVGETKKDYFVLGGNQSNEVNIVKIAKTRLFTARSPKYNIAPITATPYFLDDIKSIETSQNEE